MNPYQVLGVRETASEEEIRSAYLELVKKYHPDKYRDEKLKEEATKKMQEINAAYEMIKKGSFSAGGNSSRGYSGSYTGDYAQEFSRVEVYINAHQYEAAMAALEAIPLHNARWNYLAGVIYANVGRYTEAASYFGEAYRMEPNNMEYRSAYNRTHMDGNAYAGRYARMDSDSTDECCDCVSTLIMCWCLRSCCGNSSSCCC